MEICGQRAPSWQKDAGKQQLGASSLLLLVLRHVVPSLPRPVDVPNWKYLKKKRGGGRGRCHFLGQNGENLQTEHGKLFYHRKGCDFSHGSAPGLSSPALSPEVLPSLLPQPRRALQHCSCISRFHLPNFQSSPELHLCLHLCAYLPRSHPGLHPCPFPYQSDFTHARLRCFSHALLHACTGSLEPRHVPVEVSSKIALLVFYGGQNQTFNQFPM